MGENCTKTTSERNCIEIIMIYLIGITLFECFIILIIHFLGKLF